MASEYFWDTLYLPYPGESYEPPLAMEQAEQLLDGALRLVFAGDWDGLKAWFKNNPKFCDRRLKEVRGDTVLMRWLKMLYDFEEKQLEKIIASSCNMRPALYLMIEAWPKLVNMADFKKQTLLMMAAAHGDFEVVRTLLKTGADTSKQDYLGRTALHAAVMAGSLQCTEELISSCHDVATRQTVVGNTALHIVVQFGHPEIVKMLIRHAPELKMFRNEDGETARDLAKAFLSNREELAREGKKKDSLSDFKKIDSILSLTGSL